MSRRFGRGSTCLILLLLAALAEAAPRPVRAADSEPAPRMVLGGGVAVVKSGETIYDVSRRTNTPVRELIDANHLSPPYRLKPGTTLTVPQQRHHIVKPGETLNSIAGMEGVEIYSLARMNELTRPFAVKPGQVLTLPPGAAGVQASVPPPNSPMANAPAYGGPPPAPPAPPGAKPSTVQRQDLPAPAPEKPAQPDNEWQSPPPPKPPQQLASTPPPNISPTGAPPAPQEALPTPPPRGGNFLWPVKGKIVGRYGTSATGAHNDGINIAAPKGTPVRASDAGVVAYAGNELRGYGNLILVKHSGGYMTAYAHNETLLVKRGDTVKRGQEIARVGSTGIVSSPQLHFEIRQGTKVLDPDLYLPGG